MPGAGALVPHGTDCRLRGGLPQARYPKFPLIPDFLCLLTAAAGLISFSPAQLFGVLAALPLLIAALIRPECMGGGDIKLTAAAGFVLGFWRGIWGMALGLLLAVLYFCTAMLFQKFIHHPLPAMTRAALPLGPFLSIGFAALYCFGG